MLTKYSKWSLERPLQKEKASFSKKIVDSEKNSIHASNIHKSGWTIDEFPHNNHLLGMNVQTSLPKDL